MPQFSEYTSYEEACNSDMPAQNTDDYFFSLPPVIFLQVSDHPTSLSYKYLKLLACGEEDLRIAL